MIFSGREITSKSLALTYDDGPATTDYNLLAVLAAHGVKATFFMQGTAVEQHPEIAQTIARGGHVIGNHTMTHPCMPNLSRVEMEKEIDACEQTLQKAVGAHSRLFRPPYVATNDILQSVLDERGLDNILWCAAGHDWRAGQVAAVSFASVQDELNNGYRGNKGAGIILLHDTIPATEAATDLIITHYKREGFTFYTVPELMEKA